MLRLGFTRKGLLSAQLADLPWAPHVDGTSGSVNFAPVTVSQESTGRVTWPLPDQEQLGLQQSQ
jgi:hypothetical protein